MLPIGSCFDSVGDATSSAQEVFAGAVEDGVKSVVVALREVEACEIRSANEPEGFVAFVSVIARLYIEFGTKKVDVDKQVCRHPCCGGEGESM